MKENSILLLTNTYPDFKSSYRGVFIEGLASLLQADGYQISVVTPKIYSRSRYFEQQNGVNVYRFPFLARNKLLIEYKKIPYLRMILYYISGFFLTLYVTLKRHCDVIHVHWAIPTGLIGVWVGTLMRKPLYVTIHGSDFRMAMDNSLILQKLLLWVCKRARHITCVSETIRRELERQNIASQKLSVIPMGVGENFLKVGRDREKDLDNRTYTVLSNRNLQPIYNVSLLVRAIPFVVRKEPRIRFLIAGDGPKREDLEKEVKDLDVCSCVAFLGKIPHDEMPGLLAKTDIYVSTSLCDGTSVSLLEAMASGAFPIVTDIPSNREWIKDGDNGFLIPVTKERLLAEKILEIIGNQKLFEKSFQKNLSIVTEKALLAANLNKMKGIYTEILAGSS